MTQDDNILTRSVEDFIDATGARTPTPGGGSVAGGSVDSGYRYGHDHRYGTQEESVAGLQDHAGAYLRSRRLRAQRQLPRIR